MLKSGDHSKLQWNNGRHVLSGFFACTFCISSFYVFIRHWVVNQIFNDNGDKKVNFDSSQNNNNNNMCTDVWLWKAWYTACRIVRASSLFGFA